MRDDSKRWRLGSSVSKAKRTDNRFLNKGGYCMKKGECICSTQLAITMTHVSNQSTNCILVEAIKIFIHAFLPTLECKYYVIAGQKFVQDTRATVMWVWVQD